MTLHFGGQGTRDHVLLLSMEESSTYIAAIQGGEEKPSSTKDDSGGVSKTIDMIAKLTKLLVSITCYVETNIEDHQEHKCSTK